MKSFAIRGTNTVNLITGTRDRDQTYSLPSALFLQAAQEHQFSPDPPGGIVTTENYSKIF